MKVDNRIKYLIQKFIAGDCSSDEIDDLVAYFKKSQIDENFPEAEEVLNLLNELPEMDEDSSQRIYSEIINKAKTQKSFNKRYWYGTVAAVLLIVLGAAFYLGLINNIQNIQEAPIVNENMIILEREGGKTEVLLENGDLQLTDKGGEVVVEQNGKQLIYQKSEEASKEIEYNTLYIPYGKQFQVELSDGTLVIMNAGSSLKFPVNFPESGTRKVFLAGEAFFKVAKDEKNPFIVNIDNLQIGVLGTEFNVAAYPEDPVSNVVLVEGSVKLSTNGANAILEPGQLGRLQIANDELEIEKVETGIYTAWMQGDLVFRNMSFENILLKMERHYNVKIINNDEVLAKEKFNARFHEEPLTNILEYFRNSYGLNYKLKDDGTIIIE